MGLTLLLLSSLTSVEPSWADISKQILACKDFRSMAALSSSLESRGDRRSKVGSAICRYYITQSGDLAQPISLFPSSHPSTLLLSTIKDKPTAEELVWRWKLCKIFREPDLKEPEAQQEQEAIVGSKKFPVFSVTSDQPVEQRCHDIASILHRRFAGTPEDRYIQALETKDARATYPTLKKLGSSTALWSLDASWSAGKRAAMFSTPSELKQMMEDLKKGHDPGSLIFKIRFR